MYSRRNPSARYRALLELYRRLHAEGERRLGLSSEETYPGISLLPHVGRIKQLINRTASRTVLDYGCGKGQQYDAVNLDLPGIGRVDTIIDYWDIDEVTCYDPCVPQFDQLTDDIADGVIATDVLEHCPETDVPWILGEMFAHANRFVFASIACYPALTRLPNGENAHCTIQPPDWWRRAFSEAGRDRPTVVWEIFIDGLTQK